MFLFFFFFEFHIFFPIVLCLGSKFNLHSAKTADRKPSAVGIADPSSAFASKTDSTEHLERLRQKLHQLRSLPSTSCDFEQTIAVSVESPPPATTSSEPDLDQDELLDIIYERRPSASATTPRDKSKALELPFLASRSNSLQRTPRSLTEHNGLLQTVTSWTTNTFSPTRFSTPSAASTSELMSPTTSFRTYHDAKKAADKRIGKVLGPHCTQFLAKIGLLKGTQSSEHSELDDHQCFKSNETVSTSCTAHNILQLFFSYIFLFEHRFDKLHHFLSFASVLSLATMLQTNHTHLFAMWTDLYRSILRTRTSCDFIGTMDYPSKSRVCSIEQKKVTFHFIANFLFFFMSISQYSTQPGPFFNDNSVALHCHPKPITFLTNNRMVWFAKVIIATWPWAQVESTHKSLAEDAFQTEIGHFVSCSAIFWVNVDMLFGSANRAQFPRNTHFRPFVREGIAEKFATHEIYTAALRFNRYRLCAGWFEWQPNNTTIDSWRSAWTVRLPWKGKASLHIRWRITDWRCNFTPRQAANEIQKAHYATR